MEKVWFLCSVEMLTGKTNGIGMRLSRYFGMPAVRAGDVSELFADRQALNPDDMLIPMPRCLPMEFSWSLFFAQEVGEEAVSDVLPRVLLLRHRGRTVVHGLERDAEETRHYIYVDNVGVSPWRRSSLSDWKRLSNPSSAEGSRSTNGNSAPEAWRCWVSCLTGNGNIHDSRGVGFGRFVERSWR